MPSHRSFTSNSEDTLSKLLHRLSELEHSLVHDPLVQKEGKALFAAAVVRAVIVLGASDGTVQLVRAVLHSFGA